jgi:hypothetical protein
VLESELPDVLAPKGPFSGEEFHVHNRQAVLVGVFANFVRERLRRGVDRGDPAHQSGTTRTLQLFDQAEVGDFHPVGDGEQVSGFDVQVLEIVFFDQVVEPDRSVFQESDQDVPGNARAAALLVFDQTVVKVLVGKFHHDAQLASHFANLLNRQDEWVANFLDSLQSLHFLESAGIIAVQGVEVTEDEFDRLVDSTGGDALPDLSEPAGPDRFDQAVSRDRFRVGLALPVHERVTLMVGAEGGDQNQRRATAWPGESARRRRVGNGFARRSRGRPAGVIREDAG